LSIAKRSMWMRVLRYGGLALLVFFGVAETVYRPDKAVRVAAGMAAHTLCSAKYVSGLDPAKVFDEHVRLVLGPTAKLIGYSEDAGKHSITSNVAGLFSVTAKFTPGYGCRIEYPENEPLLPATADSLGERPFASADSVSSSETAIATAVQKVFAEVPGQPVKNVKAVIVMRDGRIVAERYAPGYGVRTELLSYSVAKSITNALLAVLVRQGRVSVGQQVGAPEWNDSNDPRHKITLEDLLRMRSGLAAEETGTGFDPVSDMEFLNSDMAAFAASHFLKRSIGSAWEYTSANTLILDRFIGQTVGGGAAGLREFAQRELFTPLGIQGVTLEFDGGGTFIGSTFAYATARDYARFGELYRNDGVAPNGQRILPERWVEWSRRSTLGEPYGAGFWTNDGGSRLAHLRIANGFPADGFFASGFLGQRIYIVQSQKITIVRFGYSAPPSFGIGDDVDLISAVIAASGVLPPSH
jgi:CubicO group peptidase (beta-lactamase class C family)